ncbi:CD225/dispanin family protein [Mycobacterium sp. OTB74]|uniref:CD225/dispanin family protein n=1 Tax=Mycobacterium sp. OTB74 TaxID=1853452 RepID=UPI0024763B71|nr:CD225/dispanin family protein [Mycobacterium sp. OTB74]MDH6247096.1 hypothetical protein [Mycobacterium sp. OTB74]
MGGPPDNYLVWGILCTLLCCLPFGIVSILQALKVENLWRAGQFPAAQAAAEQAKKWAIWGAISGPIISIIMFVVLYALGIMTVTTSTY